jgi:hypothetical protein
MQIQKITTPSGRNVLGRMTTEISTSHYRQPEWSGMRRLRTGEAIRVSDPLDDGAPLAHATVIWSDEYWALIDVPDWQTSAWFVSLRAGTLHETQVRCEDDGQWCTVDSIPYLGLGPSLLSGADAYRDARQQCRRRNVRRIPRRNWRR